MSLFELVVVVPFAEFLRGERITDQSKVGEVLASEHQHHVVRVAPQKTES